MDLSHSTSTAIADDLDPAPAALPDKAPPAITRATFLLLCLVLAIAGGLRLWEIGSASFWLDEYLTVALSSGHGFTQMALPNGEVIEAPTNYINLDVARPWYEMWTNASGDVHPPLFYLVLRLWREIVPDSDAWIRGLPALLSVIAIGLLFLAIHTQAGPAPALWASALMALAGVQIEYAQECRSYPLMLVCLLGTAAAVLRIERYGFHWLRGIAVGIGALGAAMTHYLAFPILIVIGIYVLWQLRGRDRINTVICFAVAGVGFCVLWMPWMLQQKDGFWGKISFTKEPAWTLGLWLYSWVSLPTRFLVNSTSASPMARWCGVAWFILPALLLVRQPRPTRPLLFWWMWLTLGAVAVAIGDLGRNGRLLSISRYTLMVSPGVYALGGLMFAHLRGWRRHVIPALLCAGCIAALPGAYLRYKADWRSFGAYVAGHLSRDNMLVMYDPPDVAWRIRCDLIGMQYYDRALDVPIVLLSAPPGDRIEQRIRRARAIWFFTSYPGATVEPILPGARVVERFAVPGLGTLDRIDWSGAAAP